jgi:hypothetical protein
MTIKATKYTKLPKKTKSPQSAPISSIARPSKTYPKLDFWFENKPSGSPALKAPFFSRTVPCLISFLWGDLDPEREAA